MTSPVKVFVSYSHKDKVHLNGFVTAVANMRRQNEISTWTDKDITGGSEWKDRIDKNLLDADIIILLISPDFINSDYCIDVEMNAALSRHNEKTAKIIPVYVRVTDVKGSVVESLQGLPTDRRPINQWNDGDSAWKDVVEGLRLSIVEHLKDRKIMNEVMVVKPLSFSEEHIKWLNDTEITLVHRVVDKVKLRDIYVFPDVLVIGSKLSKIRRSISSQKISKDSRLSIIVGEEQAGKTSLAKAMMWQALEMNLVPVYVNGSEIRTGNIDALIEKRITDQYLDRSSITTSKKDSWVVMIDNIHSHGLNKKHFEQLISGLNESYFSVVLFAKDTFRYVMPDYETLEGFDVFQINDFGNVKRAQLIEKWVSLGVEESIAECDMYKECDDISLKINSIVRKKLLPSKPIFIISILQMLEAYTSQRLDMTSHGHCYQSLVYQALERINIKPKEIDRYMNVMTELAWAQYSNQGNALSTDQLGVFYEEYAKVYLRVDRKKVTEDLHSASILSTAGKLVSFKYPYIYYFFAAKKIADSFSTNDDIKKEIQNLLAGLHREDYANIIIFITHHTKDAWILDEIQMCLMELFSDNEPATLKAQDTAFLEDFLKEIPRLVIKERKVQNERVKHQERLDNSDEESNDAYEHEDSMDATSMFAKINKVFKGAELIGQIVRNRHASLSKAELTGLIREAYDCGLRFLQFFIDISDLAKEEVILTIAQQIRENPLQTDHAIIKEAKGVFLMFTYSSIYALVRKIASSTGCVEAEEIYREIEFATPSPAIKLINQAIQLDFHKKLDHEVLDSLASEFKGNVVCDRILKEIAVQHIYMFPVSYRDKQRISECLDIPMSRLQMQDLDKNTKMLDA